MWGMPIGETSSTVAAHGAPPFGRSQLPKRLYVKFYPVLDGSWLCGLWPGAVQAWRTYLSLTSFCRELECPRTCVHRIASLCQLQHRIIDLLLCGGVWSLYTGLTAKVLKVQLKNPEKA